MTDKSRPIWVFQTEGRDPDVRERRAHAWRRFEAVQARRERGRLGRLGRIIPANRCPPQMMVKDQNGRWCPEIKVFCPHHHIQMYHPSREAREWECSHCETDAADMAAGLME